ncbi:tRNA lysidine(34) synthetase TilS [Microvirga sp. BT689]|uniref:tRNA lysidine(34) synthetase TilS n=1 Tax=Microvirga arvi TaxID=2778731 RepID=UPI001951A3FF|nr:tRNA lysidine(34) synthetase TilS [Microvirga arvi]MBM6579638.1 tRNA lysidine(34) synthetase TilS [Microvirga arvi]
MAPSSPPDDPLSNEGLDCLFSPLNQASGILAAVSGGPDSIALMHCLARWASTGRHPPIFVATIDHGLRPEAADEAAFVAAEASALNLPHRTLPWTGEKPKAGIQEAAREARYRLLVAHAREAGASHLVTAHTLNDQAETVLMRLSRGSGLSGLSGMRRETDRQGIRHVRPLLDLPKSLLVESCRVRGWRFVVDPSNADERYARVRWRRLMPLLAEEGLTAGRLARLAERAAQADEALAIKAREALARGEPHLEREGLSFQAAILAEEPFEIALRVLEQALYQVGLGLENIRLHRLEACVERLRQAAGAGEALSLTIAGALVRLDRSGRVSVGPEPPRRRGR